MATREDVLSAFAYYIGNGGYYEKASAKNLSREVADFAANKGSANYTYMGKLCGINPGAWCAMMVSTAVYEACENDKAAARKAMWGIWPYRTCDQLFDAGLKNGASHYSYYQRVKKGKGGSDYTPVAGDVIVFSDNGSIRTHTGIVYAVDEANVYTYEGNSGNMARKRSYALTSSYIYGYVALNLSGEAGSKIASFQKWLNTEADGEYGIKTKKAVVLAHQKYLNETLKAGIEEDGQWGAETFYATERVQMGDENDDVRIWQGLLYCLGYDPLSLDGAFGTNTEAETKKLQTAKTLNPTGIADRYTWAKALGYTRPRHTILRKGASGAEVRYMQRLLADRGYAVSTDGCFGDDTVTAVTAFQTANGLEPDAEVGPLTWAVLE